MINHLTCNTNSHEKKQTKQKNKQCELYTPSLCIEAANADFDAEHVHRPHKDVCRVLNI